MNRSNANQKIATLERAALTPQEFGDRFGKSKQWSYRLYYEGKVRGIRGYGTLMIPATEVDRICAGES